MSRWNLFNLNQIRSKVIYYLLLQNHKLNTHKINPPCNLLATLANGKIIFFNHFRFPLSIKKVQQLFFSTHTYISIYILQTSRVHRPLLQAVLISCHPTPLYSLFSAPAPPETAWQLPLPPLPTAWQLTSKAIEPGSERESDFGRFFMFY